MGHDESDYGDTQGVMGNAQPNMVYFAAGALQTCSGQADESSSILGGAI